MKYEFKEKDLFLFRVKSVSKYFVSQNSFLKVLNVHKYWVFLHLNFVLEIRLSGFKHT